MKYHVTIQVTRMSIAALTKLVSQCVPEESQEDAEIAGNTIQFDSNGPLRDLAESIEAAGDSITKFWVQIS